MHQKDCILCTGNWNELKPEKEALPDFGCCLFLHYEEHKTEKRLTSLGFCTCIQTYIRTYILMSRSTASVGSWLVWGFVAGTLPPSLTVSSRVRTTRT